MKKDNYSYKNVYRRADKEIEAAFGKVVNVPEDRDAFLLKPKVRIGGNVKLF
jgi:hypothetical protein